MGICFSSVSETVSNKKAAALARMSEPVADIALIGLAVMGQNLILNMNDHGFKVVAYNRTTAKVDDFLKNEVSPCGCMPPPSASTSFNWRPNASRNQSRPCNEHFVFSFRARLRSH